MRLSELSRSDLAALVPELLLSGHLIDRSGMPHVIAALGRDGMRDVAIEEWMGASPVYTRRMQRALGFEGDTVETIFKGMQLDIGAPPQFMDFRYALSTPYAGEFWLDHCGALMDAEPMGEEYVVAMCHDIEDPTFDATAIATNRRARVRPIHRPPRVPSDRAPHCHWTVVVSDDHPELPTPAEANDIGTTAAATVALAAPDPAEEGDHDYAGPLVADLRFEDFSRSALLRITEEVCLQMHLLTLSFLRAVRLRTEPDDALAIGRRQFTGIAGLTAERLRNLFDLGTGLEAVAAVLELHPAFHPRAYVDLTVDRSDGLVVTLGRHADAFVDGAWPSLLAADALEPLAAIVRAVDPRCIVETVADTDDALVVAVRVGQVEVPESPEVSVTRFSTGSHFGFADRGVPVEIRPTGRLGSA